MESQNIKYFNKYVDFEKNIHGPMRIECAYLIRSVNEALAYMQCKGDMLEIGVLKGRSAIPAACFLSDSEKFTAVDPFGSYEENPVLQFGGVGDKNIFFKNWKTVFGHLNNLRMVEETADSFSNNREFLSTENGQFKYISVDGDHSYTGTLNDLNYAVQVIKDMGVIAIDDVFNNEWPTVSMALSAFLEAEKQFVPFCSGWGRLFLCKKQIAEEMQIQVKERMKQYQSEIKPAYRILKSFEYFGVCIDIYTNRWGSASKQDLDVSGYQVGAAYEGYEKRHPYFAFIIRKLLAI